MWQIKGCILGNLFIPNVKVSRSLLQRKLTLCIHVSLQLVFVPRLKLLKMGGLAKESIVYEKDYESLFFHSFVKTDPLTLWSIIQARSSIILHLIQTGCSWSCSQGMDVPWRIWHIWSLGLGLPWRPSHQEVSSRADSSHFRIPGHCEVQLENGWKDSRREMHQGQSA